MPLRTPLSLTLGLLALGVLGGCAESRAPAPALSRIEPSGGVKTLTYLHDSLRFRAPANWAAQAGSAPLVVTVGSGPALIAIWRYHRASSQVIPVDLPQLRKARTALIGAVAARDRTFRVISSAIVLVGGVPAVELDALETIRGQVRRVRSTHFYAGATELVVDEYAPEEVFHAIDRAVFSPLLHSVRLIG